MDDSEKVNIATLETVVSIVSAYVSHNSLRAADLPDFIMSVHASIGGLLPNAAATDSTVTENPAVAIKKSVTKDHIVCLEDGKKFKSLRRHLSSFHNMTPDDYRAKWNLPSDYPMVAPSYSATRSQLAKESGLGQIGKSDAIPTPPPQVEEATADGGDVAAPAPKTSGRGRPRKPVV